MPSHAVIDDLRRTHARAASHGYGAGRIEANRLIGSWPDEEAPAHASAILTDVELAQAYAQEAETDFDEYARRVLEGPFRGAADDLRTAYEAGFDMGFSATLVEGCGALMGRPLREG